MPSVWAQDIQGTTLPTVTSGSGEQQAMEVFADGIKKLPVPALTEAVDKMLAAKEATSPSDEYFSRSSGNFHLFIDKKNLQTAILLVDANVKLPLRKSLRLDGTEVRRPIFVLSNLQGVLETKKLPRRLQDVIRDHYYNVPGFKIERGVSNFGRVELGGELATAVKWAVGAPQGANGKVDFTVRWAVAATKAPSQKPESAADHARSWLAQLKDDMAEEEAASKGERPASKKLVLEFQTAPQSRWSGPLGMSAVQISDVTVTWDSTGTLGYTGNAYAGGKKLVLVYEGPYSAAQKLANMKEAKDAMDFADIKLLASTPEKYTLKDYAQFALQFQAGMMPLPAAARTAVGSMLAPLDLFEIQNPKGQPSYQTGDAPPPLDRFNLVFVGPLAEYDNQKGPLLALSGNAKVLGMSFAQTKTRIGTGGLVASFSGANAAGPLSNVQAGIELSASKQFIALGGGLNLPVIGKLRSVSFNMGPGSISLDSPAECTSPFTIKTTVPFSSAPTLAGLVGGLKPEPVSLDKIGGCLAAPIAEVGKRTVEGGKFVYKWSKNTFGGKDPARPAYDCTEAGLDSEATVTAHPPSRLWAARDEYERGKSSGAWTRYIFSEKTGKFHPFGAKGALGGTACGGLVGEAGTGLGRFAADNEIWNKALMCHSIPEPMKGPAFSTADECYALRGLSVPRPDLAGKMVVAQGDKSNTTQFITAEGIARRVGGGNDWRVYQECGLSAERYPAMALSLHDIYKIPQGAPLKDGNDCRAVMGAHWKPHPRAGQLVYVNDVYKNSSLVTREGTKRWIANKDKWTVWQACGITNADMIEISAAEAKGIPDGPAISSGEECKAAIAAAGGRLKGPPVAVAPPPTTPQPSAIHPRAGQVIAYCDKFKNTHLVTRDGKLRWFANKDKWGVWDQCGKPAIACVSMAEVQAIPAGPAIGDPNECKRVMAEARAR